MLSHTGEITTDRKEAIILKTIEIVSRDGLGTTTKAIMKEMGFSESLAYRYFESKEDLISQAFRRVCRDMIDFVKTVKFPDDPTPDNIMEYMKNSWMAYFTFLQENPEKGKFYLFYTESGHRFPEGYYSPQQVVVKILNKNYEIFRLMKDYDVEFIAEYVISIANVVALGVYKRWYGDENNIPEKLWDLIINGIVKKKSE